MSVLACLEWLGMSEVDFGSTGMAWNMTKHTFVSTTDSSLQTLSLTYDKDASTYTSVLFDFVATGLRTIQFLFISTELKQSSEQ
jgi:hypothetical protein